MKNLSRDEIEHQVLQEQLKGIIIQMNANFEVVNISLEKTKETTEQTLAQTKLTNGRVTTLESDIIIIRTLKKHPYLSAILIFGLMKIFELVDIKVLMEKLLNIIL